MLVLRLITIYTKYKSVKLSNRCVLAGPKVRKFSKEWKVEVEFIIFDVLSVTEYFLNIELKIDKCEHFNLLKDKKNLSLPGTQRTNPQKGKFVSVCFHLMR